MTACLEFSVGMSYCDPFSLFGCFNGVSPAIDQLSPRDSSLLSNWKGSVIAVMRFIFSYSASTYLPLPIFGASWLLDFQAFTAISSDFLLSSEVSRLVTPGR